MNIDDKLLWDLPKKEREQYAKALKKEPVEILAENESLFVKALNSLSWYELIGLFGPEKLNQLLTEQAIGKLYPPKRREYYKNAQRLLSQYALPASG